MLALIRGIAMHIILRDLTLKFYLDELIPVTSEQSAELLRTAMHALTALDDSHIYCREQFLLLNNAVTTCLLNACTYIFVFEKREEEKGVSKSELSAHPSPQHIRNEGAISGIALFNSRTGVADKMNRRRGPITPATSHA
jgi:hypothetical protein